MILVSLFLCSLLIRRIGVKHGFPLLTHPDESVIIDRVVHMTLERTLNPGNFNRPNQILYLLNFLYLNILSFIRFGEHLGAAFPKYYLNFYAYARFLISIMGAMIPVIAYKMGTNFAINLDYSQHLFLLCSHHMFYTPFILRRTCRSPCLPCW